MDYDLEERTAKFSENVIDLIGGVGRTISNENILKQMIRSATSVGANYCEANNASSKKDFKNKIYICKKDKVNPEGREGTPG
jgi:four helix bundle protein